MQAEQPNFCCRHKVVVPNREYHAIKGKLESVEAGLDYSKLHNMRTLPWTPLMVHQEMPSGRKHLLAGHVGWGMPSVDAGGNVVAGEYLEV